MRGPCVKGPLQPTLRQLEVLHVLERHRLDRGFSPTIRELGALLGIGSTNCTAQHLRALIKKGLLMGEPHAARTLQATPKGCAFLRSFAPSAADERQTFKPTGNTTQQVKTSSQAVNNAAQGEG